MSKKDSVGEFSSFSGTIHSNYYWIISNKLSQGDAYKWLNWKNYSNKWNLMQNRSIIVKTK